MSIMEDADGFSPRSESMDDSDFVDSDIEFELYSQLHYHLPTHTEPPVVVHSSTKHVDNVEEKPKSTNLELFLTPPKNNELTAFKNLPVNDRILHASRKRKPSYTDCSSDTSEIEEWEYINNNTDHPTSENMEIHVLDGVEESSSVLEGNNKNVGWDISAKDALRQISRYYTKSSLQCKNCLEFGHIAEDCREVKRMKPCHHCGQTSHRSWTCMKANQLFRRGVNYVECYRCGQLGHNKFQCPDIWRQFHLTVKPGHLVTSKLPHKTLGKRSCYNCSKFGHRGHKCDGSRKRTFEAVSPTVFKYDHWIYVKGSKSIKDVTQCRKEIVDRSLKKSSDCVSVSARRKCNKKKIMKKKKNHIIDNPASKYTKAMEVTITLKSDERKIKVKKANIKTSTTSKQKAKKFIKNKITVDKKDSKKTIHKTISDKKKRKVTKVKRKVDERKKNHINGFKESQSNGIRKLNRALKKKSAA